MKKTPTTLILLEGFGLSGGGEGSAVLAARTPRLDGFRQKYAHAVLAAAGPDAGLPPGQSGESEAGRLCLGAGRTVPQDLVRVTRAAEDGGFARVPAFCRVMDACREQGAALHLAGVVSDGGVRSHTSHLSALLRMAKERELERVWIHAVLDSRDVPAASAAEALRRTAALCWELGTGKIATVLGPAPEEERLERCYDAMVYGATPGPDRTLEEALSAFQAGELGDPVVLERDGSFSDNDGVIFFDFRPDRALLRTLADPAYGGFPHQVFPLALACTGESGVPDVETAFPRLPVPDSLGEYLSRLGLTQLRVSSAGRMDPPLFDGGEPAPFPGVTRVPVQGGAAAVRDAFLTGLRSGAYDFAAADLNDCDLAGHTGDFQAAAEAVEAVDACVGEMVDAALQMGGVAMIAGTHGNAERMRCPDGSPDPGNTANPVPCILCGAGSALRPGTLADAAPTLLDVMGLACPEAMEGSTLIVE